VFVLLLLLGDRMKDEMGGSGNKHWGEQK
jgi:hypothetical protein